MDREQPTAPIGDHPRHAPDLDLGDLDCDRE